MINMDKSIKEINEGTKNADKLAESTKAQAASGDKALKTQWIV